MILQFCRERKSITKRGGRFGIPCHVDDMVLPSNQNSIICQPGSKSFKIINMPVDNL
ncbi:hypothetical protein LguiA_028024 [Lonicera macranthoides]